MLLARLTLSLAHARDPDCAEVRVADLQAGLDAIDEAFVNAQVAGARRALSLAEKRIPCIVEVVPKETLARFAVRYAYALAGDLDTPEAQRWAQLAATLDPTFTWPAYVPPNHEVRKLAGTEALVSMTAEGVGLVIPDGGGIFLDGRFLETPTAEPGVPHLLQVGDGAGFLVESRWQDGVAFPEELLGPPLDQPPPPPRWFGDGAKRDRAPRTREAWSDTRWANLERAGGFAAMGGALLASALAARGAYDARPTTGLFVAVDGATVASGVAGTTAVVFLGASLFGR